MVYRSGLSLFLSFYRRQPGLLVLSLLAMIASSLAALLPAIFVGSSIDILQAEGLGSAFTFEVLKILAVGLIFYGITFFAFYTYMTLSFGYE